VDVVKLGVVKLADAELENINARHTKDVPNIVVVIVVIVARPAEDAAVNLGIDNFLIILYIMGRTRHTRKRHTRKRHTRRKHKRKRTRRRRRTRRRTGGSYQVFGGGYKEGLQLLGGAKSTYGVSDYPPGFSEFLRRDKRIVDKMKRKSRKHKRRRRKH